MKRSIDQYNLSVTADSSNYTPDFKRISVAGDEEERMNCDESPKTESGAEAIGGFSATGGTLPKWGYDDDDEEDIEENEYANKQFAKDCPGDDNPGERLLYASEHGDIDLVQVLLNHNANLLEFRDGDGYSALHRAAYMEHPKVVQELIARGADVNWVTNDGWTALHSASRWNSFKSAKILIEAGADINAKSKGGSTPLHFAAVNGRAKQTLALLLLQPNVAYEEVNKSNETPLEICHRVSNLGFLFELQRKTINII